MFAKCTFPVSWTKRYLNCFSQLPHRRVKKRSHTSKPMKTNFPPTHSDRMPQSVHNIHELLTSGNSLRGATNLIKLQGWVSPMSSTIIVTFTFWKKKVTEKKQANRHTEEQANRQRDSQLDRLIDRLYRLTRDWRG